MKFRVLIFFSCLFFLQNCRRETPQQSQTTKYLWRIEKHALQGPRISFVTYFSYDLQNRITQTSLYRVDSTGAALDSALVQRYTYQYSGASVNPDFVSWLNNSLAHPPDYGLFGTQRTYIGPQLVKDSTYLISGIPPQSSNKIISNYLYAGSQVSSLVYSGITLITKDTLVINGGNITRAVTWEQISNYATEYTYSFDNKINPINVPLPWGPYHQYAPIPNSNNIVTALLAKKTGPPSDSVRWVSQFQYDSDNYPLLELQDEHNYFFPPSLINYVINYRYY